MFDFTNNQVTSLNGVQLVINGTCNSSEAHLNIIKTNIIGSGGFAAVNVTEEVKAGMVSACNGDEAALAMIEEIKTVPTIFVEGSVAQFLTPEELAAVVAHEEAHITYGHLFSGSAGGYNQANELEADAVGAKAVSKAAMHGALLKIARVIKAVEVKGEITLDIEEPTRYAKEFQERLDALV